MNDEKHEEIRRGNSALIKHNPKVFQPLLFYSISVKEHVMKKSKTTGPWTYLFTYLLAHRCLSSRFVPSRRRRKSGLFLN